MNTTDTIPGIPMDLKADLREALDTLARGIRDPEAARKACERMDRMREENRRLLGEQTSAVEIIRDMRDSR
ncbi:MAG: hypothetical protein L0Z62_29915 [Gemmataceae bacterium]|nr:hypothetical protein [Gemmataceae bacterium]